MKHFIILIAALLLTVSAAAQNGRSIYQKYSDEENVSAVYISPAMFRLIGKIPEVDTGDGEVNFSSIIRSLSGMYIINSENEKINGNLRAEAERFINSGKYEMLMEAKDSGQTVRMYTVGNEKTVEGFVMLAAESASVTFICLDGRMPRDEFEQLMAKQMAD